MFPSHSAKPYIKKIRRRIWCCANLKTALWSGRREIIVRVFFWLTAAGTGASPLAGAVDLDILRPAAYWSFEISPIEGSSDATYVRKLRTNP